MIRTVHAPLSAAKDICVAATRVAEAALRVREEELLAHGADSSQFLAAIEFSVLADKRRQIADAALMMATLLECDRLKPYGRNENSTAARNLGRTRIMRMRFGDLPSDCPC